MAGLLFILSVVGSVFFILRSIKEWEDDDWCDWKFNVYVSIVALLVCLSVGFFIWGMVLIETVGTGYTIDERISMYEEENASIEESIDTIVKNYMDFEATTYEGLKNEDAINLISLFPELKSDTLVQQQIEVYVANRQKIKELKEEKIDLSKAKWMLYFGR